MLPLSLPETLCREFSLSEIKSATDNFSPDLIIGKGSFGNVYKGTIVLPPGNTTIVAVKRRSSDSKQGLDEFWTEVTLLSRCQHAHLISLIGYCVDQDADEMLLVYEHMPNGTLADHIYKKNEKSVLLSWEQRLKICIGVGRGLDYLHTGTRINQIIIHRDLKSSNILLDGDWAPKISDFGLCKKCSGNLLPGIRIIPIIASIKGTRGYMDPHYCKTHELSTNTDVYAFGVVLLEVLCGRRSLDFEAAEREKRLVLWAKQCMREGVVHRLVDPGLWGSLTDVGLHVFLDITLKCLQDQPKKRPTLAEVVGKLEIALASQFATTYSSSSSVDSEIFKHFNQVAYSSTSASSNVDASRQSVETGSSKSDTNKQDPSSESTIIRRHNELQSSSENNGLEVPIDLQSTQVKTNVSIPVSSKTNVILPDDKDDEYEKLYRILNSLSVVMDNNICQNATLIQINGINIQEVLLEVVQVLTDIDCIFTKASMTSDGSWTMNVFTVTDPEGNKLTHDVNIHKTLGSGTSITDLIKSVALPASADFTVIELIGSDRPGLLSEVCTVLLDLRCNIMKLNLWTHNTRAAFIILVTDEESGAAITDPMILDNINKRLFCVFTSSIDDDKEANSVVIHGANVQTERRLHQMMLADGDYERGGGVDLEESQRPDVNVVNWYDKYCLVVTIRCADRPRLLFDTICTLTDMNYIVLHGHVTVERTAAFQEYCIRHVDGSAEISDAERQRVIKCIKAAIERRVSKGLKLKLCTTDRIGLLSDVTRIFRENGLMITRAEVEAQGGKAVYTFYVHDTSGNSVESKIIDSLKKEIGETILEVQHNLQGVNRTPQESPSRFHFGGLFKFLLWQFNKVIRLLFANVSKSTL